MKQVLLQAMAERSGDEVRVSFKGGSCETKYEGQPPAPIEPSTEDLGELKMPAEVWEFFQAAMVMMCRSQTEDYFFDTGLNYRQPKDDKYPDQRHLQIDPWYEIEELDLEQPKEPEIITATKGDKSEVGIDWAIKGSGYNATIKVAEEMLATIRYLLKKEGYPAELDPVPDTVDRWQREIDAVKRMKM